MAKGIYVGVAEDNLVVNGDFSNALNGLSTVSTAYSITTENNYLKAELVTPSTAGTSKEVTAFRLSLTKPTVASHTYYLRYDYLGNSSNNEMTPNSAFYYKEQNMNQYIGARPTASNITSWQTCSAIKQASYDEGALVITMYSQKSDSNLTAGMKMCFDNFALYDLTEMFGEGNEPDKEWCDANLEELKTLYKSQNSGVSHKVKKAYIGVDSKARKVKKGYIGVGGVARPFFSAEQKLVYYGTTTNLSAARYNLAATSIGDYALFAGGYTGSAYSAIVDTYTSRLVKGTTTNLSVARNALSATSVGDYALFAGGYNGADTSAIVDAYDTSLTRSTPTVLSVARNILAGASVGDYALFAGGQSASRYSTVDAYDTSLTRSTPTDLSVARYNLAGISIGDYALFAGGYLTQKGPHSSTVDTYTSSLVKGTTSDLADARYNLAATSVGDYALFGGGYDSTTTGAGVYAMVDAYQVV